MHKESTEMSRPANEIKVNAFRQIFHWPLSLAEPDAPREAIDEISDKLGEVWQPVTSRPDAYEEGVYFHDTVQRFLYPDPGSGKAQERRTFRRTDITNLTFTIAGQRRDFEVERLSLDLFGFGAAVITLEISARSPGMLADVQTAIDYGRRAFPGFWLGEQDSADPGYCPSMASITINSATHELSPAPRSRMREHWHQTGVPQVFPWWQMIAAPLALEGHYNPQGMPVWRHVLDERIPVMSFVSITNPDLSDQAAYHQIGEGDWFRIACADQAGNDAMPYNAKFLLKQSEQLFYDRFHLDGSSSNTTRQCYAGYHYAMVGSGDFFDTHAQSHFSSHYRQMNFIAHLEFATLLTFSRRISDLVDKKNCSASEKSAQKAEAEFRKSIHVLRSELLSFTHRYTFTDVSNHLQAREMNRMLRDAMGLEALRADVQAELTAASDFAMAAETRLATESQTRLTEFASLFLPATLATGFGGMNLLAGLDRETGASSVIAPAMAQLSLWVFVAYAVGSVFLWLTSARGRILRISATISALALCLATLIWVWETRHGTPFWPNWSAIRVGWGVFFGSENG